MRTDTTVVRFRPVGIADQLVMRTPAGQQWGATAKTHLDRYFALLEQGREELLTADGVCHFSQAQLAALLTALQTATKCAPSAAWRWLEARAAGDHDALWNQWQSLRDAAVMGDDSLASQALNGILTLSPLTLATLRDTIERAELQIRRNAHQDTPTSAVVALDQLRSVRYQLGFTLTALAKQADLHLAQLSKIETGQRVMPSTAEQIANALGVPPDHLTSAPLHPLLSGEELTQMASAVIATVSSPETTVRTER